MRWKMPAATAACVLLAAAMAIPAEAAPRKRVAGVRTMTAPPTVFVNRDESGRTRTRIIVQRRSFLDAGTEVLPGQRKFTDYVDPPGYRPLDILGPGRNYERQPLNGYFDVPHVRTW